MFRIERRHVNLGAARSIHIDGIAAEADVAGEFPNAAASAANETERLAQEKAKETLSEAEKKAKEEAERIIEDARREAAALKLALREQAEEEHRRARQEGFAEGAEEGKHSYDEQLEIKLRECSEQLETNIRSNDERLETQIREDDEKLKRVIGELYDERRRAFEGLEDEVVGLALGIVRKILDPAEAESSEIFETLIKSALKQINPDGKIVIRLSPAEYERFFQSGRAVFEMDSGATLTASILKDQMLGSGDIIIDTEDATVNAGLDSQLKYIQLAFDKCKV